ncbi:uncharacterized protein LOC132739879 isoform X2 [Ruditapes philippinarum]|uniref:uncharacterized protein LOC132739879 isoform X2 n=1 Tax=Ruditapes philippinarum TaxID=129788 RepID=UPI00295AF971|nr:uncharacterized protein LOC132739879 isoform X2 [Ruditapes philippinarum]
MFHLQYPRFRGFFAWDELGCLSRALGFPVDLFKNNLTDEINTEENGLSLQETIKVLDYKLLYKALHLTQNLHTADWNSCVFRRCVGFLDFKALKYEDINNARVAYQAYEAGDMKGMMLSEHVLLRTLKMCNKTISPMKLMHRIKHSQGSYDEPGRIQLYEFLDLLLWADGYKGYIPDETYGHFEMKNELFKLTDFDKLLTHHDHRVASHLDAQYLKEEWEFPEVRYKDTKFKDSTVICGDSRVEMDTCLSDYYLMRKMSTTNHQKQSYRHLRSEVGRSEKTVHCAKGGFVRERPVTAPNIGMYSSREMEELKRKQSMRAQSAIYQKLQDLVRHAYKSKDKGIQPVSMSDRPIVADYKPSHIPHVVSDSDLKKTVEDWEQLLFDIETEEGRYEIAMDTEMEHFIPNFKQKKEEMERSKSALSQGAPHIKKKCVSVNKQKNRYEDSVNALAYPAPRLPPSHSRRCDARFRGWYAARSKKGPHYVLMSPYFHDSPKGKLFQKLAKMSDAEIQKLHGDLLYRKTKSVDLDQRPVTAPAVMTMEEYRAKMKENDALLKGRNAGKSTGSGNITKPHVDFKTDEINDIRIVEKEVDERVKSPEPTELDDIVENVDESKCSLDSSVTEKIKEITNEKKIDTAVKTGKQRALSAYAHRQDHLKDEQDSVYLSGQEGRYPRSKSAAEVHQTEAIEDVAPMPYMDHSKPKIVSVGSIGKISLLESISEAKFWEDLAIKQQKEKNKQSSEIAAKSEKDDSGTESIGEDAADDALITEKIASQSKKKNSKNKMHSDEMLKDTDIISLILEDEKALKKKLRKYQKKSKFDYSTARSWSSGSSRASKLGSANSRSSSSSGIRTGTPGTPGASVKENCLSPDPCQTKSDSQNANQVHSKSEDKATSAKKKVIVSDSNDTSKANVKPKVSKYERLVNRLGDDLTPYMKHQMMKITV